MFRNNKFTIPLLFTCTVCTFLFNSYVFGTEESYHSSNEKISEDSLEQRLKRSLRTLDIHIAELTGYPLDDDDEGNVHSMSPRAERDIKNLESTTKAVLNEIKTEYMHILNDLKPILSQLEKNNGTLSTCNQSTYLFHEHQTAIKSFPIGVDSNRICEKSFSNGELLQTKNKKSFPSSCRDVLESGNNASGIYQILPRNSEKPITVLCDMETNGGGWTHIQKRFDGSQDFFLGWREYKFGFGDLQGEFWLGLENIYKLTGLEVNELLVELVDRDNKKAYAHYKAFGIGPETEGYPLNVLKGFTGDAGDSLTYHLGCKFSTKDFDQDKNGGNCAETYMGAWWYNTCHYSNLNGRILNVDLPKAYEHKGMHWAGFRSHTYNQAKARMMVRPAHQ